MSIPSNDQHGGADMSSITEKKCSKCGEIKSLDNYTIRQINGKHRPDCKDCVRSYHKKIYDEQAEEKRAYAREYSKWYYQTVKDKKRQYAIANKDKIKGRMYEYQKEYYKENKERIDKKNRKWFKENWDKDSFYRQRRRSLEANAEGSFTPREWKDLCKKYNNQCLKCGKIGKMSVDHIIPLSKGGTNWISNIQPLCRNCNSSKRTETIDYRPPENQV